VRSLIARRRTGPRKLKKLRKIEGRVVNGLGWVYIGSDEEECKFGAVNYAFALLSGALLLPAGILRHPSAS
jgi:hypothetical protein